MIAYRFITWWFVFGAALSIAGTFWSAGNSGSSVLETCSIGATALLYTWTACLCWRDRNLL